LEPSPARVSGPEATGVTRANRFETSWYDSPRPLPPYREIDSDLSRCAQRNSYEFHYGLVNDPGYWYVIPEPGTATMLLFGAIAGLLWRRRR